MSRRPDKAGRDGRPFERRLKAAVLRAQLALFWEHLWPSLAGLATVAAAFAAVSWFGLWLSLPPLWRLPLLLLFAAGALYALIPLLRLRFASRDRALRRLEQTSGLEHRPLVALEDTLGGAPDSATRSLWEAHRRRMAERLGRLKAGAPSPRMDRRDPYALRALALLLFVAGFFYAEGERTGRLLSAFETAPAQAALAMRVDAWVAPPPYTGRPPIVLTSGGEEESTSQAISVPQKSDVVVRIEGGEARVDLVHEDGTTTAAEAHAAPGGRLTEYRAVLEKNAVIRVLRGERSAARWTVGVEPDKPPSIRFSADPEAQNSGALKLSYTVEDDYGVVDAEARFEQKKEGTDEARPLYGPPAMRLSLPQRRARSGSADTMRNLTDHPWSGATVQLTLAARDEAGNWGTSEIKEFELPARGFNKPLARAVVEQRRNLALDANSSLRVSRALGALMIDPARRIPDKTVFIGLSSAISRLELARSDDDLRSVVDQLWAVALRIEDGDLSIAERDLRAAQEALRKALENGASDAEIEKLMKQLREAMNRYLNELMAQLQNQPPANSGQTPPNSQTVSPQDLDEMLRKLEELARSGARDAARDLLAQLQNLLENLQTARPMPQDGNNMQSQMGQALDKLGNMIREQQRLMDDTFRQNQENERRQGRGENGQQQDMAEALRRLQEGQGDLRQQLQQLMEQLGQMGAGENRQLGEAGESMGQAEQSLGRQAPGEAVGDQAQALDRLRRGAQSLQQQLAQQMGEGQNPNGQRGHANDDPLGRPQRRNNQLEADSRHKIPDQIEVQRAREILEELRRRLSEPGRPKIELEYLERLLERF